MIFDRHAFESIIDYQIMLDQNLFGTRAGSVLLSASECSQQTYLEIPTEDSMGRCLKTWDPFPDTEEEEAMRHRLCSERIKGLNCRCIDGLADPDLIHNQIRGFIQGYVRL